MTDRSSRWARIPYEFFAPCVFLFILPITHTTPLRVACLVIAAVTTLVAAKRRPPAGRPALGLLLVMSAWILMALVTSATSIEPEYSWGEFRNEVLSPVGAFGVFFFLTSGARAWRLWRNTLLASIVVVSILAITSYLSGDGWAREGFVGDRNAMSTYVVLVVPFVLLLWIQDTRPSVRAGIAVAGLLALLAAVFTQNRNIWFAIAIEALVFAALVWWKAPREHRGRLALKLAGGGLIMAVLLSLTLAYVVREKAALSNLSVESQARFDRDPRFEIWAYAGERIRERPWSGYGFGRGILRKDFRSHFDNPLKWHGHNMVVNYVMEAGVFGGVVLVALFAALMAQAAAIYRRRDPFVWPFGLWAIAMLTGIALKVMTDDVLIRENSLLLWSVLGMVFGLALRTRDDKAPIAHTAAFPTSTPR